MSKLRRSRLEELKIKASILLKDLLSHDEDKSLRAAKRFRRLPLFADKSLEEMRETVKRKHVLALLAAEHQAPSWDEFRERIIREDCLESLYGGGYINHWFARYEDAKRHQELHGGYLLQFRKDYFVAGEGYIETLGLGELSAEWEKIGYDWAKPGDRAAWEKLFRKAKDNYLKD